MVALLVALGALAHPIHTTSASLIAGSSGTSARLVVRAFIEDFPPGNDSIAVVRYLAERLSFTTPGGRRLAATLERVSESSGVLSLTVSVSNPGDWAGIMVDNQLMCERFRDQVNVLQIKQASGTQTLLFTPGSRPQALK